MSEAETPRNGVVPLEEPDDAALPATGSLLHGCRGTAVVCIVSFGMACQYGAAFLLLLELPFVAIWLIYSLVGACVRAERRARFARQLLIGTVTAAAMIAAQAWLAHTARRDADAAVAAIEAYRASHGAYPATLEAVGIDRDASRRRGLMYWPEPGSGRYDLSYASLFSGFDRWIYDPGARRWDFQPD